MPKSLKLPIIKICFSHVTQIDRWIAPLFSKAPVKGEIFAIYATEWTEMKKENVDAPYVFVKVILDPA